MLDWIELLVRWLHVIAGIAWIGSSFYFIFLDASLRRRDGMDVSLAGESWQVHGGGFYRMQKYLVAPGGMPDELHWFKWEAYTTWLSGFGLLCLTYYLQASVYLVDTRIYDMTAGTAVTMGAISLAVGWLAYDLLCRSPLGKNTGLLAAFGVVLLIAAAWGYAQIFSGRGAYIHTGVLIGSMMAGNVFFVIIPNQKKVVADLIAGRTPNPALGIQAKQRSLHNNYLTLPVVFVMLSGHYPATYGGTYNWLILAGIFIAGGLVRHFFNQRHAGKGAKWWLWLAAAAVMSGVITIATPKSVERAASAEVPGFAGVQAIIAQRCVSCHSAKPTFEGFDAPPLGVSFDSPEDIQRNAQRIFAQTVATNAMPLGNVTEMTDAERAVLSAWISAGAKNE